MVVESTQRRKAVVDAERALPIPQTTGDPSDSVIRQLFSVSIELHAALGMVQNRHVVHRIDQAIRELDEVIKVLLNAAFDAHEVPRERHDP